MSGRKKYIKPEEVSIYQRMGYRIYRGPRGGIYVILGERENRKSKVEQFLMR